MSNLIELRQLRADLLTKANELNDKAEAEGRDLTADEQVEFDKALGEAEAVRGRIERQESLATLTQTLEKTTRGKAPAFNKTRLGDSEERAYVF